MPRHAYAATNPVAKAVNRRKPRRRSAPAARLAAAINRGATHGPTLVQTPAVKISGAAHMLCADDARSASETGSGTLLVLRGDRRESALIVEFDVRVGRRPRNLRQR